ncbi:hypothetical protein LPJ53_003158 [Coemansia erecta]|uniref:alpha-1,2-Mannosidase n=1 Tax=Coemansia erecta TaxID=147472 RepID=A0A9W7Y1Y5_9FUNG|nr:hypothetical protein LPJ53_003158 [Coemansia erecta]
MPRISLRGLFFTLLSISGLIYLVHFYGMVQRSQVDRLVNKVSQIKLPWNITYPLGDSFRNSEMTMENHQRQQAVRDAMAHAWKGYTEYAFGKDELQPISRSSNNRWGDWAITLVDSLDTLKLMEMDGEYTEAKEHLRGIDFSKTPQGFRTQVFEMIIRALGGLLGAYELDDDPMILEKARQVGDTLSYAFTDSINGMPSTWLDVNKKKGEFSPSVCIAEAGTLQLEFKKLSQYTGDPKYAKIAERASDALERGMRRHQGLYPSFIYTTTNKYDNTSALSVGAMADSFYEYQLKQYILHGGREKKYKEQYVASTEAVKQKLVAKSKSGLLFLGRWGFNETIFYDEMEHLACFYPGLLALGAQVLDRPQDLVVAEELARTCYLSYKVTPTGLGSEIFTFPESVQLVEEATGMHYAPNKYGIVPKDPRYILRPETIEALFILYRVTENPKYQEWGWEIFNAIEKYTKTDVAYAAYVNVYDTTPENNWVDSMESFFLAETLKYLYLLFSPTDLLPLDEFVLNTEAHPFKIMKPSEEDAK